MVRIKIILNNYKLKVIILDNLIGEFFGTMILVILGDGVVANMLLTSTKGEKGGIISIATAWGFAVTMGIFTAVALGAPQADLNPAVTLTKTLNGVYTPMESAITMLIQLMGAFVGAAIVWLAYLPHWQVTKDQSAKLGVFCTAPAIRCSMCNLLCEVITTVVLIVGIFCIYSAPIGVLPPGVGPFLVGVLVWGIGLSLGGPTGYAINPARDLGPRLAHAILPIAGKGHADWGYAWIPVVGPFIGAILAFLFIGYFHLV